MPPKKQSDETLPPPIKKKIYPKKTKKQSEPLEASEIIDKKTKKEQRGDVYDKIEKARNKVNDFNEEQVDTSSESDYDNSDDEKIKFQIIQEPEPVIQEPEEHVKPVQSKKKVQSKPKKVDDDDDVDDIEDIVKTKKHTERSSRAKPETKSKQKYDPEIHYKQEQQKLKSLYDNQFQLLKEENNKLRNLNDYQTHLQRLTHMSRNVKIKF